MQKGINMTKIVMFFYVMIIIFSVSVVAMNNECKSLFILLKFY